DFNVPQTFGGAARQAGCFAHDCFLDVLDSFAEQICNEGNQEYPNSVYRHDGPVQLDGVNGYEDDAYQYSEKHIDETGDELHRVLPNFGQDGQGLTAPLVFKFLIRQRHGMLQSVCKYLGTVLLGDNAYCIVLKRLCNPAYHRCTYKQTQEIKYPVVHSASVQIFMQCSWQSFFSIKKMWMRNKFIQNITCDGWCEQ